MLTVVEYLAAVCRVGLGKPSVQYLGGLSVERVVVRQLAYVGRRQLHAVAADRGGLSRSSRAARCGCTVSPAAADGGHAAVGCSRGTHAVTGRGGSERHHALPVYIPLAPRGHLTESQPSATEARVEQASAQRYAEQGAAASVLHHIQPVAMCRGLLHELQALAHAVARLIHSVCMPAEGPQPQHRGPYGQCQHHD